MLDNAALEASRGQAGTASELGDADNGVVFLGEAADAVDEAPMVVDPGRERAEPA